MNDTTDNAPSIDTALLLSAIASNLSAAVSLGETQAIRMGLADMREACDKLEVEAGPIPYALTELGENDPPGTRGKCGNCGELIPTGTLGCRRRDGCNGSLVLQLRRVDRHAQHSGGNGCFLGNVRSFVANKLIERKLVFIDPDGIEPLRVRKLADCLRLTDYGQLVLDGKVTL